MISYSKTGFKRLFYRFLVYKNKSESKIYISFFLSESMKPGTRLVQIHAVDKDVGRFGEITYMLGKIQRN